MLAKGSTFHSGNTECRHPLFRPGHMDMDTNVSTIYPSLAFPVIAQEYQSLFTLKNMLLAAYYQGQEFQCIVLYGESNCLLKT